MHRLKAILYRLGGLWRRRLWEDEMAEELQTHLEDLTARYRAKGLTSEEARQAAQRRFGVVERVKETCRDERAIPWIETLRQDVTFGARLLRRNPGFTSVAVLTLALGIGATTTVFSVIRGVLLKPLPYPGSERIVHLWEAETKQGIRRANTSPGNFFDWRREGTLFEAMACSLEHSGNLTRSFIWIGQEGAERLRGRFVSSDFFRVLGTEPMLGRGFLPLEEQRGARRVVVLSHRFWAERLAADPGIVGRSIILENQGRHAWEVIGVMPPGFNHARSSLWVSLAHAPGSLERRGGAQVQVMGRLKPGVTIEAAESQLNVIQARIHRDHGHLARQGRHLFIGSQARVESMLDVTVGSARFSLVLFFVSVVLVLLIACANVANLLLARGFARAREIAIRAALGAHRGRIVRQMLTESLLLSLFGAVLCVLLAFWGVKLVVAFSDGAIPRIAEAAIDLPVLGFTLVLSLATGLLFGLVPAWRATRTNLNEALKSGTRGAIGGGRHFLNQAFTLAQVALALLLLIGAGLLLQSFVRLQRVDPGFEPNGLLVVEVDMAAGAYATPQRRQIFFASLLERLRGVPGVEAVCGVSMIPDRGSGWPMDYRRTDRPAPAPGEAPQVGVRAVTPGFVATYRIRLLQGRDFLESDSANSPKVILVNQAFADALFPGENPVGQLIHCGGVREIIGVIGNVKNTGLAGETRPEVFVTYQQWEWPSCFLTVRTAGDPLALAGLVTEQVRLLNATSRSRISARWRITWRRRWRGPGFIRC